MPKVASVDISVMQPLRRLALYLFSLLAVRGELLMGLLLPARSGSSRQGRKIPVDYHVQGA